MKKIYYIAIIGLLLTLGTKPVLADLNTANSGVSQPDITVDTQTDTTANAIVGEFRKAANTAAKILKLKQAGDSYISARSTSLTSLSARLSGITLDSSIKATLQSQVDAQVTALADLKTKIGNDADVETLKADVRSVFDIHHIYAVFMPAIQGQITASRLTAAIAKLAGLEPKIESYLTNIKSTGVDTSKGDTAYQDYKNQLTDAKSALASALVKFSGVDLTQLDASRSSISEGRVLLSTVRQDLSKAKIDLETITSLAK